MRIYNTETKTLEEFKPITPGKVSMYVCGPTVYNLIHIGNARPMIKANEEGVDASVISERYIKECKKDMADLNVRPATTHPQATKEIQGMIDMISTLIDKGYAYVVDDGTVYFAVDKDPNYGELSHKNLDDLQSGFRSIAVSGSAARIRREVLWTLCSGSRRKRESRTGIPRGARDVRAGISNARSCPESIWERRLTSTRAERT